MYWNYKEKHNQLYAFGQNTYGELGMGDITERNEITLVRLTADLQISQIAAGNELTLILTEDSEVYMCGFFESNIVQPMVCMTSRSNSPKHTNALKKIDTLSGQKVSRIFAHNGCEHALALTRLGKLWVFGCNARGQLGLGDNKSVPSPVKLEFLSRKVVHTVGTSYYHTIIACEDLETYGCGRNDNGQLGISTTGDILTPTLIEDLNGQMISSIGCGQYHTVIATVNGQLFACGKNESGQLGISPYQPISKKLTKIEGIQAKNVACGYYHTLAISPDKKVYSWGKNDSGQLGLEDKGKMLNPTIIDSLSKFETLQIACGCYHSLVLTSIFYAQIPAKR